MVGNRPHHRMVGVLGPCIVQKSAPELENCPGLANCFAAAGVSVLNAGSLYAGPRICAPCHPAIAKTCSQTGMGRSFFRLTPDTTIEDFTGKNRYYHTASDTYYEMLRRKGMYFQRRYQLGPDHQPTNIDEKKIEFVIGSGNHARTYLHLTARGTLMQLPLAWYSERGGFWAMSSGYDSPNHPDNHRVIGYDCMFCATMRILRRQVRTTGLRPYPGSRELFRRASIVNAAMVRASSTLRMPGGRELSWPRSASPS